MVAQLEQRHVAFYSLREAIDTTIAAGKLQLHLFAALAEFERADPRALPGRPRGSKAAGRLGGRPTKLTADKRAAALAMRERGDMTMTQIARALGIGRTSRGRVARGATLYAHLGELPPLDDIDRKLAAK